MKLILDRPGSGFFHCASTKLEEREREGRLPGTRQACEKKPVKIDCGINGHCCEPVREISVIAPLSDRLLANEPKLTNGRDLTVLRNISTIPKVKKI